MALTPFKSTVRCCLGLLWNPTLPPIPSSSTLGSGWWWNTTKHTAREFSYRSFTYTIQTLESIIFHVRMHAVPDLRFVVWFAVVAPPAFADQHVSDQRTTFAQRTGSAFLLSHGGQQLSSITLSYSGGSYSKLLVFVRSPVFGTHAAHVSFWMFNKEACFWDDVVQWCGKVVVACAFWPYLLNLWMKVYQERRCGGSFLHEDWYLCNWGLVLFQGTVVMAFFLDRYEVQTVCSWLYLSSSPNSLGHAMKLMMVF